MALGGGGGGGAGGGLTTDANGRLIVEDDVGGAPDGSADVLEHPLASFGVDVDPPTIVAGASLGVSFGPTYGLVWGQDRYVLASYGVFLRWGDLSGPTLSSPAASSRQVQSVSGPHNTPHSISAFGCGIGGGDWSGWREQEYWRMLVVPAHPANMAGVTLTITLGATSGYAPGTIVRVRGAVPTEGRQGTPVATIAPGAATSVFIPGELIPAEGGELWLGLGPSWEADYAFGAACVSGSWSNPLFSGERDSGSVTVTSVGAPTWATYSVTGGVLGTLVTLDEDAPWEGGNEIRDAGTEGAPVSGVDGGKLYVTAEEPSGRGILVVGDLEDETQPAGPWSLSWSPRFRFDMDVLGDEAVAGVRSIELTTTREGARTIGTIHLGDLTHAPGISVATPSEVAYKAVALTAGAVWAARFDDRCGRFKGKVWLVSDGEPADWDVEVAMAEETGDHGDRWTLWIRAGNGAGFPQTVRVWALEAAPAAQSSWVHERLGVASGLADRFSVSHPFVGGSLAFDVAGVFVPPSREDPDSCLGILDYVPTAGMVVWARYQAD